METPASPRRSHLSRNIVIILIVLILGASVGYYAYQYSFQPNIQATDFQTGGSQTFPQTTTVQDQGRVSSSGSFSYTASTKGIFELRFDNLFSTFSSKHVSVSYTAAGASDSKSFTLQPGQVSTVQIPLNNSQSMSGTFSVSGGSGNDVDFSITKFTCSQSLGFSFVLVNSGNANGYATVVLQTERGAQVYSNKYFVQEGQQVPISGTATVPDCVAHTLSPTVMQQKG